MWPSAPDGEGPVDVLVATVGPDPTGSQLAFFAAAVARLTPRHVLALLARMVGAHAAVEIGTGAGVSCLALLAGMEPDGILTSIDLEPERLHLLPALRAIVVTGGGVSQLASYLAPHSHMITCVAGDHLLPGFDPLLEPLRRARHCALGTMQKPPFDGPVDLRQANDAERAQC